MSKKRSASGRPRSARKESVPAPPETLPEDTGPVSPPEGALLDDAHATSPTEPAIPAGEGIAHEASDADAAIADASEGEATTGRATTIGPEPADDGVATEGEGGAVAAADEPVAEGAAASEEATPADADDGEPAQVTFAFGDDADGGDEAEDEKDPVEAAGELSRSHLRGLLEALVFASDKPLKTGELAKLASAPVKQVREAMAELKEGYSSRGFVLDEVAGGWLFRTHVQYAPFVRELTRERPVRLTRAQLETLAIAAYRQPITRPEIDEIRGVDSGATLKLLLERDLVRILGKKDEPGRPILYGTTAEFLSFFGLKSLSDLPTLREFTELSDESRKIAEEELGEVLQQPPTPRDTAPPRDTVPPPAAGDHDTIPPLALEDAAAQRSADGESLDPDALFGGALDEYGEVEGALSADVAAETDEASETREAGEAIGAGEESDDAGDPEGAAEVDDADDAADADGEELADEALDEDAPEG